MKIRVLAGKNSEILEFIAPTVLDQYGEVVIPDIDPSGRFISFQSSSNVNDVLSIHDYLLSLEINLGFTSNVEYVGYTKNPNKRPLNSVHGGLTDVLYNVSNEENDIFIFFNIFKVTTKAFGNKFNINYSVSNAIIDEVQVKLEGKLIELCFIVYFDSKNQNKKKSKEIREAINKLKKISVEHNISSINIMYEVTEDSEYYKFGSSVQSSQKGHFFSVRTSKDELEIEKKLVPNICF